MKLGTKVLLRLTEEGRTISGRVVDIFLGGQKPPPHLIQKYYGDGVPTAFFKAMTDHRLVIRKEEDDWTRGISNYCILPVDRDWQPRKKEWYKLTIMDEEEGGEKMTKQSMCDTCSKYPECDDDDSNVEACSDYKVGKGEDENMVNKECEVKVDNEFYRRLEEMKTRYAKCQCSLCSGAYDDELRQMLDEIFEKRAIIMDEMNYDIGVCDENRMWQIKKHLEMISITMKIFTIETELDKLRKENEEEK